MFKLNFLNQISKFIFYNQTTHVRSYKKLGPIWLSRSYVDLIPTNKPNIYNDNKKTVEQEDDIKPIFDLVIKQILDNINV